MPPKQGRLDPALADRHVNKCGKFQTHSSRLIERVLEYQLLAALTPELLRRGMSFEILCGDCDLNGHDLVIETGGIMRHIQLKGQIAGGKASRVDIHTDLAAKPSGCVIWMTYEPVSFAITGWRWFGGAPGQRLPELGERLSRQTRGAKAARTDHRVLTAGRFTRLDDVAMLADRLFGPMNAEALRRHLRDRTGPAEGWLAQVQAGNFAAIPTDLDWDGAVELAHLIDGYALVGQLGLGNPCEYVDRQLGAVIASGHWQGNATELWITLFLEHRRWRFSTPHEPDPAMMALLDTLVRQLRRALTGEQN